MQSYIVEVAQEDGPWGARGIGEHSMVPTIPAIANAIFDAVGVRLDGPPFTAKYGKRHLDIDPERDV
jgi:carbon-monoxide dehydrogenase large subunit